MAGLLKPLAVLRQGCEQVDVSNESGSSDGGQHCQGTSLCAGLQAVFQRAVHTAAKVEQNTSCGLSAGAAVVCPERLERRQIRVEPQRRERDALILDGEAQQRRQLYQWCR